MNPVSSAIEAFRKPGTWLPQLGRLIIGYFLATAAGSAVFIVIATARDIISGTVTSPGTYIAYQAGSGFQLIYFIALIMALLPTIMGLLVYHYLLPKTQISLLLLGAATPFITFEAVYWYIRQSQTGTNVLGVLQHLEFLAMTAPAGLAAAYVLGAVVFRQGFGRWRPA